MTKMEDDKTEDDQNGRQPKLKTTKMEEDQNERRPKWKKDQNGSEEELC